MRKIGVIPLYRQQAFWVALTGELLLSTDKKVFTSHEGCEYLLK
jgi:hemin uptake protein HemP